MELFFLFFFFFFFVFFLLFRLVTKGESIGVQWHLDERTLYSSKTGLPCTERWRGKVVHKTLLRHKRTLNPNESGGWGWGGICSELRGKRG